MENVQDAIEKRISIEPKEVNFKETAKRWACYCLDKNEGVLLDKGLALAKALADYHFELTGEAK